MAKTVITSEQEVSQLHKTELPDPLEIWHGAFLSGYAGLHIGYDSLAFNMSNGQRPRRPEEVWVVIATLFNTVYRTMLYGSKPNWLALRDRHGRTQCRAENVGGKHMHGTFGQTLTGYNHLMYGENGGITNCL